MANLRQSSQRRIVWTVAGFDPSGGAGVTADLLSFAAHGHFGCSAITGLTVQTTVGVFRSEAVAPDLVRATLEQLEEDMPADGIKVGMLAHPELGMVVAAFLKQVQSRTDRARPVVVFDPVLRSSSGLELYPDEGVDDLHAFLLPCVDWTTPNWAELAALSGLVVSDLASAERAARALIERHPRLNVVATGGDQERPTDLVILPGRDTVALRGQHIATSSTHGTGCAFSSALLSRLVDGVEGEGAVRLAKRFVEGGLRDAPGLGRGRGPMDLLWSLRDRATLKG